MRRQQRWLAALVGVGGAAVLGSYGLLAPGAGSAALWGGVPQALLPTYQANMALATAGFFAYTSFLLLWVDPGAVRISDRFGFGLFYLLYAGILVPSALWMPLTLAMLRQPGDLLWWTIRAVLAAAGLSALGLTVALVALTPRKPRWAYVLAVVGSLPFTLQTLVLDALIWPALFPVAG
jgi:hypothetical protein